MHKPLTVHQSRQDIQFTKVGQWESAKNLQFIKMHWLCNDKWSRSRTRPASTLKVTWTMGSPCSAASTKSPAPLASSATPHSSSPTSSSNDDASSTPTREQTVCSQIWAFFFLKCHHCSSAGPWTASLRAGPRRWPCLWRRCCRRLTT